MLFVILSTEIVYESKKCLMKLGKDNMLGDNPERSFLGGAKIPNVSVPLSLDSINAPT